MKFFFFFFQAEDGIRDLTVTGVQTCALPIFVFGAVGTIYLTVTPRLEERLQEQKLDRLQADARTNVDGRTGFAEGYEIGRASCRERGEMSVVAVSLKRKKK